MTILDTDTVDPDQTLALLWSRIRQRGDLPGFSSVVRAILGAMRGDDDGDFNMTKTVLSDPALTQRVLRLANSPMYSVFGQSINTVSRAVVVLGTEAIGHLALGLKLIEGLSAVSRNLDATRSDMERAVLSGHIAREVASSATARDGEEAAVCSMLHSLGQIMLGFYLPEYQQNIEEHARRHQVSRDVAAIAILGIGAEDIGREVARRWGFPGNLIDSMARVAPRPVTDPLDHHEWLASVATLATDCARALCDPTQSPDSALSELANAYADMLGIESDALLGAVNNAVATVSEDVMITLPVRAPAALADTEPVAIRADTSLTPVQRLKQGIDDIRQAMDGATTGRIVGMALEVVHRVFGCSRSIAFLRHRESGHYAGRLCFGEHVQEMLTSLVFPDAYQPDVFHAALASDKMICIANAQEARIASKLPRWWKATLQGAHGFMLLPLSANRHPIGFLYGDWAGEAKVANIGTAEIDCLDELRHLLVQVMHNRRVQERRMTSN